MYTRRQKVNYLTKQFNLDGLGLEIGPHVDPMFRRSEGINVRYLETRDGDTLRALVIEQGRDPSIVEDIDYVLQRGKTLAQHAPGETFDWVTSSHVVEHIPDFLGHLKEVEEVLSPNGVYGLIVPDMNYCFDCLKSKTLLGQVIEAHISQARPGAIAHMVNEWRYGARPRGIKVGGWTESEANGDLVRKTVDWKKQIARVLRHDGKEVENWFGHQWFFDLRNYGEIICDLMELELLNLQLEAIVPTYNMDFMVVLRKSDILDVDKAKAVVLQAAAEYREPNYKRKIHDA